MFKYKTLILIIIFSLAIAACGGPPPPPPQQEQQQQPPAQQENTLAPASESQPTAESQPAQTTTQTNDCPGDKFVTPSGALQMTITCTDDSIVIASNNVPNFTVPGTTSPEQNTYYIPRYPQVAAQPVSIPILGAVGVTVNGLQIQGPNGADFDGYPDPIYENMVVECNGHHANQTLWHFHGRPDCIFSQLIADPNDDKQKVGVVMGYAFDGFPILSPYVCTDASCSSVEKLTSSWQRVYDVTNAWEANVYSAGSGDLDQCNGRYAEDGTYAYYATDGFPYFMGCYTGTADARNPNQFLSGGNAPPEGNTGGQPTDNQGGQQGQQQGQPDLQAAADKLGITLQQLEDALGPPPPDLAAAAQKLGITEQALREALGVP